MSTSRTQYVVLGLLCTEPMSGYDLKRNIEETVGGFWQESFGQLYPTLRALAAAGLVTEELAGPRGRRVYHVTEAGRRLLGAWLAEPAQAEHTRSELALKVFFGAFAPEGAVEAHLREARDRSRAQLAAFAEVRRAIGSADPPAPELRWWRLTIGLGERIAAARAEWADHALRELGVDDV